MPHWDCSAYSGVALVTFFIPNVVLIRGWCLFAGGAYSGQRLFGGSAYLGLALIQVNRVLKIFLFPDSFLC